MDRSPEPDDADELTLVRGWLSFHRDALRAKCEGMSEQQLVLRSAEPSHLSLLGLVRHLCEMEHAYGSWPMSQEKFVWVWGEYVDEAEDDIDCTTDDVAPSFAQWREEISRTDRALAGVADLGSTAPANGRSVRWNLLKLVGEYARHNGHADIVRERIDGATGE